MQHKLLINGELVSGEGEKQPVYNPATGDVLLEIAEASAEQVNAAVRAADAAFAAVQSCGGKPRRKRVRNAC